MIPNVLNPYAFLMVTLALLFSPSTTPTLEYAFFVRK